MRQRLKLHNHLKSMLGFALCIGFIIFSGCKDDMKDNPNTVSTDKSAVTALAKTTMPSIQVKQVNLVSDLSSFSPGRVDETLLNAWGIAFNPNGIIWISANHSGVAEVYDSVGNPKRTPVIIPKPDSVAGGAPTGVVFNPTSGFTIPTTGQVSKFIFATEDGTILAWASGDTARIIVDHSSSGDVFKGLTLAQSGSHSFIYATDFHNGRVEVFDEQFNQDMTKAFNDPGIPAGFAPFNIQAIDGLLFVTYAKQKGPDNMDDEAGPGNGYIDIYNTNGELINRFASQGMLNSPWGLAEADGGFGRFKNEAVLVGNFGDGHVTVFDRQGNLLGQLSDAQGAPLVIGGLWALSFREGADQLMNHGSEHGGMDNNHNSEFLYFTAGPNDENDGLFGYLQSVNMEADGRGRDHDHNHDHGHDHH